MSEEEENSIQKMPPQPENASNQDPFREFRVNVVVDNADTKMPPVIIENFPTLRNLFGVVERDWAMGGWAKADHLSIRTGSFHRANGGYLVVNALDMLIEPGVWKILK